MDAHRPTSHATATQATAAWRLPQPPSALSAGGAKPLGEAAHPARSNPFPAQHASPAPAPAPPPVTNRRDPRADLGDAPGRRDDLSGWYTTQMQASSGHYAFVPDKAAGPQSWPTWSAKVPDAKGPRNAAVGRASSSPHESAEEARDDIDLARANAGYA